MLITGLGFDSPTGSIHFFYLSFHLSMQVCSVDPTKYSQDESIKFRAKRSDDIKLEIELLDVPIISLITIKVVKAVKVLSFHFGFLVILLCCCPINNSDNEAVDCR